MRPRLGYSYMLIYLTLYLRQTACLSREHTVPFWPLALSLPAFIFVVAKKSRLGLVMPCPKSTLIFSVVSVLAILGVIPIITRFTTEATEGAQRAATWKAETRSLPRTIMLIVLRCINDTT